MQQALRFRALLSVGLVALFVTGLLLAVRQNQAALKGVSDTQCGFYRSDETVNIGSQHISAEVAKTPSELEKGLGGRACIGQNQGMLFVFDKPGYYSFWMKDMRFPIDIIWLGSDHKVVTAKINVNPGTYPNSFTNQNKPAQYVLELQANRSKTLHLDLGTDVNF